MPYEVKIGFGILELAMLVLFLARSGGRNSTEKIKTENLLPKNERTKPRRN
jgi:hypothetical protein